MVADETGEAGWPVRVTLPVAWGEMDALGHVNNIVYFRYFESARIAYFERVGMFDGIEDSGVGPILAHTDCRFRIPLTYPDTVDVESRVTEIGDDRFQMEYRVISRKASAIAAEGTGRIVCLNYRTGRKTALPDGIRAAILRLEARSNGDT